jgi:putative protease
MEGRKANPPELLAPAGSPGALVAAVNAGADAVYLGGKSFGARMYAANFSPEELEAAVAYAHQRMAKVYVTLNILLHDHELTEAARYLVSLYSAGVDGVLVQDPGVAALARELVPGLPLHASTQCTLTDEDGLLWARMAGFERVVLARELSLAEIDRLLAIPVPDRPGIEIFVHGALCYAYSGQCLLSSVIGGRSGNRGRCAQPCRKPYRLVTGTEGPSGRIEGLAPVETPGPFLLSTKDLCLLGSLREIVARPIDALKIEGRMRSDEYVAIVVSRYRRAIDDLVAGRGRPADQDEEDLAVMFSRGFTGGYLSGECGPDLMGRDRPDNRGLFLGRITGADRRGLRVLARAKTVPLEGDGLVGVDCCSDQRSGFILRNNAVPDGPYLVIPQETGCRPGMDLYLTRSVRLEREAEQIIARQGPPGKLPLDIDLALTLEHDRPPVITGTLTLRGGDPVRLVLEAGFVPEPATGRPTPAGDIERQVRKTGGTVFRVRDFSLSSPGDLFLPLGLLNQFRRDFLGVFEKEILARSLPQDEDVRLAAERLDRELGRLSREPGPRELRIPDLAVICDDAKGAEAALAAGCGTVYLEPEPVPGLTAPLLLDALGSAKGEGLVAWKWPQAVPVGFSAAVRPLLPLLRKAGLREVMVDGAGSALAIRRSAPGIGISGGSGLNIFNHRSVLALSDLFDAFTLSPELSGQGIGGLAARVPDTRVAVLVQGSTGAMVTADNLGELVPEADQGPGRRYGLVDQTDRLFPFRSDALGRTTISNAAELCLLDHLPILARAGVDRVLIDARGRGAAYTGRMTALYVEALSDTEWLRSGDDRAGLIGRIKPWIRELAHGGISSGPFLRGLRED